MRFDRTKRISEEIKKIVSQLIMSEIKDPRIPPMTSVNHVETTKDLRFVTIYISLLADVDHKEVLDGLNSSKGFIRKAIGHELSLRYTPEPVFKIDDSIRDALYLSGLIDKVNHPKTGISPTASESDEDDEDDDFDDEDEQDDKDKDDTNE